MSVISGINFVSSKPRNPNTGDAIYENNSGDILVYDGNNWCTVTTNKNTFEFMGRDFFYDGFINDWEGRYLERIESNLNLFNELKHNLNPDLLKVLEPFILNKLRGEKLKKILKQNV